MIYFVFCDLLQFVSLSSIGKKQYWFVIPSICPGSLITKYMEQMLQTEALHLYLLFTKYLAIVNFPTLWLLLDNLFVGCYFQHTEGRLITDLGKACKMDDRFFEDRLSLGGESSRTFFLADPGKARRCSTNTISIY